MKNTIEIANKFLLSALAREIKPHGEGLINSTFLIRCTDDNQYILQNINTNVFKEPIKIQQNIEIVTKHLKEKISDDAECAYQTSLTLIASIDGLNYYVDEDNKYWRVFEYVPDSVSYNTYEHETIAINAGRAYAQFHEHLADLDVQKIQDTIPQFHYLPLRVEQFNQSIKSALKARLFEANELIQWIKEEEKSYLTQFEQIVKSCPIRIVHQDTKANNILFDKNNKAISIIDLDTVMPGYLFIDYGDALRVAGNSEDENSVAFDKIFFNKPVFESFTKGYFSKAKEFMTKAEADTFFYGIELLLFEQGLRFLTDYLNNDVYYKTNYPEHNYNRAKNQITCLKRVIENRAYIEAYCKSLME
ncbi:MAG: phosphotransferase enzyme family protein [Salinivirgaceae bacterium]